VQLKPITVIAVLLLVVASLSASGCTNPESTAKVIHDTSAASNPDAFLKKLLDTYERIAFATVNDKVTVWNVTWLNNTSARVTSTMVNSTQPITYNESDLFIIFPTPKGATDQVNSLNKTAYKLDNIGPDVVYTEAKGQAPQVYARYSWYEGNNITHAIQQFDNVVEISTWNY